MISAIIILIILGLMDLMLFVACFEMEKEREIEEEEWKNERRFDKEERRDKGNKS